MVALQRGGGTAADAGAGAALKKEISVYADELKLVHVIKPGVDSAKFAERIVADVLTWRPVASTMTPSAIRRSAKPSMAAFWLLSEPAGRSCIARLAATAAWLVVAWVTAIRPDTDWPYTGKLGAIFAMCAVAIACVGLSGNCFGTLRPLRR